MQKLKFSGFLTVAAIIASLGVTEAKAGDIVSREGLSRGTILVDTNSRRLYYGLGGGRAISYPVGVGRSGRQWSGMKRIYGKRIKPAWKPTPVILADKGGSGRTIPGGSTKNPMGAAALLLSGDGQYAIHGTNNPGSIGGFVSYGCIRMQNADIMDLYRRVWVGTTVIVR